VLLLALALPICFCDNAEEAQVVDLTDNDFYTNVQHGVWLVKYYAPWCGHCKNLAPTWATLAAKTGSTFKVAKIDCTVNRAICSDFAVRGYPTIKLIKDNKVYEYSGQRTEEAFLAFVSSGYTSAQSSDLPGNAKKDPVQAEEVEREVVPAADEAEKKKEVVVLTTQDFDSKVSTGEWLVEFYAPWCGHCKTLAPIWEELPSKTTVNVAKVDGTVEGELMKRFGIKGFPTIKFIKDGTVYDYKGARTAEAFVRFALDGYLSANATPLQQANKDEL